MTIPIRLDSQAKDPTRWRRDFQRLGLLLEQTLPQGPAGSIQLSNGMGGLTAGPLISSLGSTGPAGTVQLSDGSGGFEDGTVTLNVDPTTGEITGAGGGLDIGGAAGTLTLGSTLSAYTVTNVPGSIAIGGVTVTGSRSTAIGGSGTTASGYQSLAIGTASGAFGGFSFALGTGAYATAGNATAIGARAGAFGFNSLALGFRAGANASGSISIGSGSSYGPTASGYNSIAIGAATGSGYPATASGYNSMAVSYGVAELMGQLAIAINPGINNRNDNQFNVLQGTGQTNSTTPLILTPDGLGVQLMVVPTSSGDTTWGFIATITAAATGGGGGYFVRRGLIQNVGGTTALVGSIQTDAPDINPNLYTVSITADNATGSLQIAVANAIGDSTVVQWHTTVIIDQVST